MYGHDLLGGPPAYPNFGKSLDDIAGRSANRELAMALVLIERHGMDKFRTLYALTPLASMQRNPGEPARWQQVYGESYESIVDAWLAMLPKR